MPPMNLASLPRVLTGPAALQSLVQAADEARRPISVIFGIRPNEGSVVPPPELSDVGHLEPLGWIPRTLYVALFDPEAPVTPWGVRPPNVTLYRGTVGDLREVVGRPFAREAVSIGTYPADDLTVDLLLGVRGVLVPAGLLSLFLLSEPGSKSTTAVGQRLVRAGFEAMRAEPFETGRPSDLSGEAERPVPYSSKLLRTVVSATIRSTPPIELNEKDPFVIGVRAVCGEGYDPYVAAVVAKWLRQGFPAPIRRKGDDDGVMKMGRAILAGVPEVDSRREEIVRRARETLRRMGELFTAHGPLDRLERRRPFVAALAEESFLHQTPPYSYRELWRWLAEITGGTDRHLRDAHEDDVLGMVFLRFGQFDGESQRHLREVYTFDPGWFHSMGIAEPPAEAVFAADDVTRFVDEFIGGLDRLARISEVWADLAEKTGLSETALRRQFYSVVTAAMWQHFNDMDRPAQTALIQSLPRDLAALRRVGYEPPYRYLPPDGKRARVRGGIMIFLDSRSSPLQPIPSAETLEIIHRGLQAQGILVMIPELEGMLSALGDILWHWTDPGETDTGIVSKRFLERYRIPGPRRPA